MLEIMDWKVSRAAVVDDQPDGRRGWGWILEDLSLDPVPEEGPFTQIQAAVEEIRGRAEVAVCDYHLRRRNYAAFDGAELAAALYQHGVPTILCTRYEETMMDAIRPYRKFIPALLNAHEFEQPGKIEEGFRACISELAGYMSPERKLWRTLVRVDDVDDQGGRSAYGYVTVPAWDSKTVIRVALNSMAPDVRQAFEPDAKLHAKVNIGAERIDDVYFTEWESR